MVTMNLWYDCMFSDLQISPYSVKFNITLKIGVFNESEALHTI